MHINHFKQCFSFIVTLSSFLWHYNQLIRLPCWLEVLYPSDCHDLQTVMFAILQICEFSGAVPQSYPQHQSDCTLTQPKKSIFKVIKLLHITIYYLIKKNFMINFKLYLQLNPILTYHSYISIWLRKKNQVRVQSTGLIHTYILIIFPPD